MNKTIYIVLFALVVLGCKRPAENEKLNTIGVLPLNPDSSQKFHYTTLDTILISSHPERTLKYTEEDFNNLVDAHEEFFREDPLYPDVAYDSRNESADFESEAGQDQYYLLYAHFLKERTGTDKFVDERSNLNEIYSIINSIFQQLQNGGTFFGHLDLRIPAYTEYAVYQLSIEEDEVISLVDFTQQKELYIQSLRLLIADRMTASPNTYGSNNMARKLELERKIDNLGELITDAFYLHRARDFQSLYYDN